jgi:hypothetical protein
MSLSNSEIARIRAQVKYCPPAWVGDMTALLDALEQARAERDAHLADFTAELEGGYEMRKTLGAREGETLWGCVERVARDSADALTLLRWASDCWQDGELRGDFDDCVDAIRAFLSAHPTPAREEA